MIRFEKKDNLLHTISLVTILILLGKVTGFVKQVVTASYFGATIETDLINLSQGLIANAEYVIAQTLITAFVAVYIHIKEKQTEDLNSLVSNTIKAFSSIIVIIVFLSFVLSPILAKIIAPTYDNELLGKLSRYIKLFVPVLVLFTWTAIFRALLNANNRFLPGALIGVIQNLICIAVILLFYNRIGVQALVVAFLAYSTFDTIYLGSVSKKYWRLQKGSPFNDSGVKEIVKMMLPLLLGYSVGFINQQVDKIIVSGMESGTVTSMSYGAVLSDLVTALVASFCTVVFTRLTIYLSNGDNHGAADLSVRFGTVMGIVLLPITIITFIESEDIVQIVFGRGAFALDAVKNAAMALKGYSICFVPYAFRHIFSRFQYGNKDTKSPTINSSISIGVNIILSIVLSKVLGIFGVTLASSAAEFLCAVLNFRAVKCNNDFLNFNHLIIRAPVILLGGIICITLSLLGGSWFLNYSPLSRFLLITIMAGGLYFITVGYTLYKLIKQKGTL